MMTTSPSFYAFTAKSITPTSMFRETRGSTDAFLNNINNENGNPSNLKRLPINEHQIKY
jgi:hypothetical protein